MIKEFVLKLAEEIHKGLPGLEAHKIMAPVTRPLISFDEADFPQANKGAVMILFYPAGDAISFVLIKRPSYDGVHGGQVSFPGGRVESSDPETAFTALRECEEETGIDKNSIRVFGKLSNVYIPPSNYFVFPYLGYLESTPQFTPDKHEVEYIIEADVKKITDPKIKSTINIIRKDISFTAPCYLINEHKVWGATAIILSELEFLLVRNMKKEVGGEK
ncbi:MAG: NUDIX hydrolase [Chitinophagales bacterium]